ncbi:hypothetical protein GGI25_003523 [Coemansia spiralis]|uniref:ADF-H domain-containing protein n=1 Tax=Coemansia spiralis TaxID=417178 RepID=A0A9W8KWF4_9FUNG|nr:hypothetical protein GGI26_003542 [Coemansia sp. RSA 1358]KAJ2676488.1 hypothetical protein GGI25_003523 [Coemansia spiralis]
MAERSLLDTASLLITQTLSAAATTGAVVLHQATPVITTIVARDDDDNDYDQSTLSEINIDASYLFDWGNAPGTGPYFSANNIDAATQITSAALMGGACLVVFSMLRFRWPELYSHRLRLRQMRPSNIPRTLFGWMYPMVTMSDRHVLETIGLDALLFFRAYRMFIYMFLCLSAFGMVVLYPVNFYWSKEYGDGATHTVFDSPISHVQDLNGRYSVAHVFLAYIFAIIVFFYIDRFALHTVTMRWHYLLLTRRSGNSRTLMVTHLPPELRSDRRLAAFIRGMQAGEVESVHVAPLSNELNDALASRARVLQKLEAVYASYLGNPCKARSYDPVLLKRIVLTDGPQARDAERRLLFRWAKRRRSKTHGPVDRPRAWIHRTKELVDSGIASAPHAWLPHSLWPFVHVDAIDYWRYQLSMADKHLQAAREGFFQSPASSVGFVTMRRPADAYIISQLSIHSQPSTCKIRMAPEARAIAWKNVSLPYSKKMLRYILGLVMTFALLLLWCVPVVLISTLISLRFLVTRAPGLVDVVKNNKFVRSLLNYTLPSLILTIFMTILPRLLWSFVLVGGDRAFGIADKDMFIRHLYFLIIYIVVIFGISGPVWSSIYDLFTNFGGFWEKLVNVLPQMATWYCVYVMLYGAGYQVMKLLHLKSVCRYLFHQAAAKTPRDYMKAISPVFIDWGTFQPYTVLFFFIGILYAHLQPLMLPMTALYYIVGLFVMKYMCVYAWYFRQQNAGTLWPVIFRRMVLCVLFYQALTTAIFSTNNNHWFVAPMIVLMLFTWYYFWVRCKYLKKLGDAIPLQLLREAERRRKVVLAREKMEMLNGLRDQIRSNTNNRVNWADIQGESVERVPQPIDINRSPTDAATTADAEIGDDQALLYTDRRKRRTASAVGKLLCAAFIHPIQAFVRSFSYTLSKLEGDPARPLWDHIDDYAFPERVDRLVHPAGRSPLDPNLSKKQPGSLLDVLKSVVLGIPKAFRAIASEFFMHFTVPRAHLDSSIVDYPKVENAEEAFLTQRTRRKQHRRAVLQRDMLNGGIRDAVSENSDSSDNGQPGANLSARKILDDTSSVSQMNFSLAPAQLPNTFVSCIHDTRSGSSTPVESNTQQIPIPLSSTRQVGGAFHRASTFISLVDVKTGKPTPMQYQLNSSELPFGTQLNRKKTDFSQPNMSYLKGVLDSTKFSYLHPGMYGELPSLWLPVRSLKHRDESKRSAKQRIHDAVDALQSAIGENIIGKENIDRIQSKRKSLQGNALRRWSSFSGNLNMRSVPRKSSDGSSSSISGISAVSEKVGIDAGMGDMNVARDAQPPNAPKVMSPSYPNDGNGQTDQANMDSISPHELQKKIEDMHIENQCNNLGIDPTLVSKWDPTGLHRCFGARSLQHVEAALNSTNPPPAMDSLQLQITGQLFGGDPDTLNAPEASEAPFDIDTGGGASEESESDNDIDNYDVYNDSQHLAKKKKTHRRMPTIVSMIMPSRPQNSTLSQPPESTSSSPSGNPEIALQDVISGIIGSELGNHTKYCLLSNLGCKPSRHISNAVEQYCIKDGQFLDCWYAHDSTSHLAQSPSVFATAQHLTLSIYQYQSEGNSDADDTTEDVEGIYKILGNAPAAQKNRHHINEFIEHIKRVFPRIKAVEVQGSKIYSRLGKEMTSAVYQGAIEIVHRAFAGRRLSSTPQLTVKDAKQLVPSSSSVTYSVYAQRVYIDNLPLVSGLTSLIINKSVHSINSIIYVAILNAVTLQKLDLAVATSMLCINLIIDQHGRPVKYPRVEWLRLAVYGGVPFHNRNECPQNTFPHLKHLHIPCVYPFSNSTLLLDSAQTLENLTLGVSKHCYQSFLQFGMFEYCKYPQLKCIEIRDIGAWDPFLMPLLMEDLGWEAGNEVDYYKMALTLGAATRNAKMRFKESWIGAHKDALLTAVAAALPYLGNLVVLDVMESCVLDIADVHYLACRVPSIEHLKYKANDTDTFGENTDINCDCQNSRLSEVTVLLGTNSMEEDKIADDLCSDKYKLIGYFTTLRTVSKTLIRVNFMSLNPWVSDTTSFVHNASKATTDKEAGKFTTVHFSEAASNLCAVVEFNEWCPAIMVLNRLPSVRVTVANSINGVKKCFSQLGQSLKEHSNTKHQSRFEAEKPTKPVEYIFTGIATETNKGLFGKKPFNAVLYSINSKEKRIEAVSMLDKSHSIADIGTLMPTDACRYAIINVPLIQGMTRRAVFAVVVWVPTQATMDEEIMCKAAMSDFCAQLRHYHCIFEVTKWSEFDKNTVVAKMTEITDSRLGQWR